jgi:hypothetical protein
MATETQTGLTGHVRGVTVTTLACLGGVAAALAAAVIVGTSAAAATNTQAVLPAVAAVAIQYPLLKAIGVDTGEFGAKDHLYIGFMTLTLWFITYAILLTTGASL